MRRLIEFPCAGETLVGTLDEAPGTTGLLIVSGGNEIRVGAHRGMALLAQRLAEAGHPVFRFDRRGIGDSTGTNRGFDSSIHDIGAAAATFAAEMPGLQRIVAFGNCDAATALALFHSAAGIDRLVFANPWLIEDDDDLPPPAAIRARYAQRVRDPRQWLRAIRGGVDISRAIKGLVKISKTASDEKARLATRVAEALTASATPLTILLARGDNTAVAFADAWKGPGFDAVRARVHVMTCDTASHSFAHPADKDWLFEHLREALAG